MLITIIFILTERKFFELVRLEKITFLGMTRITSCAKNAFKLQSDEAPKGTAVSTYPSDVASALMRPGNKR